MPNPVPSTKRRQRTAAGSTPPHIAADVAHVAAACAAAARLATCCDDVTTKVSVEEALATLQDRPGDSLQEVVVAALHVFLVGHRHRTVRGHTKMVDDDALLEALNRAWSAASPAGNLDATIAAAVTAGLDGERICWDVITRESVKHVGLIRKEASKLVRNLPNTRADDLMGYGWGGLRSALRQYNPDLGFTFSTYACPRINGAIRDGVRGEHQLPKRLTTLVRAAASAEEVLTQQLARTPTYREIIEYLDADSAHVALLPRLSPAASIEELMHPWRDQHHEPACLVDPRDPAVDAEQRARVDAVRAAIAQLPEAEARAVRMLCLEERSLAETSKLLGVDARALRAIKKRALEKLTESLHNWSELASA